MPISIDAVLIDDNPWIRDHWSDRLNSHGKRLLSYESGEEFLSTNEDLGLQTPIFVDLKLNPGACPGEQFLMQLHRGGYKNLFLATSYDTSRIKNLNRYLRGIVGKEPPSWLLSPETTLSWQLTAPERQNLLGVMNEGEEKIFKSRMDRFYATVYGLEIDMVVPEIPDTVQRAWEWGMYHCLTDDGLELLIKQGWEKWADEVAK